MKNIFNELMEKHSVLVMDGAMGTVLFDHGIFINQCFDCLNLTNPQLISEIHGEYVSAGAMIIETNTFGANKYRLSSFQQDEKVKQINVAGAKLARQAAGDNVAVAGSVGPLGVRLKPFGTLNPTDAKAAFKDQVNALIDGGVDLIVLETFSDLLEIEQALNAVLEIRARRSIELPVIASVTVDETGCSPYGAKPEIFGPNLMDLGADIVGVNCSIGPKDLLNVIEILIKVVSCPLFAMPNAGLPKRVEGRSLYMCSPDYMANYARRFAQLGVKIIGGCCGTTPEHTLKICESIRQISGEHRSLAAVETAKQHPTKETIEEIEISKRSTLASKIVNNEFVASVELTPPLGWDLSRVIKKAKKAKEAGFDTVNIPDGPRASAKMGPLAMAVKIEREAKIETIMHYACRDRNLVGMQSDLLGACSLGISNLLVITGDPPILGGYPKSTAVFDVDSVGLINMVTRLNRGMDLGNKSIEKPTGFFILAGLNPTAINPGKEKERFYLKVEAGAHAAITQPVFDAGQLLSFLEDIRKNTSIPILAGIWPLLSLRNAEFLENEVPGVSIPSHLLDRMKKAKLNKTESLEGEKIAMEILSEIIHAVSGIQVAAPFGRLASSKKILDYAKSLRN